MTQCPSLSYSGVTLRETISYTQPIDQKELLEIEGRDKTRAGHGKESGRENECDSGR